MIRVLVVDDSPFMRRAITRILSSTPDIEVVGAASSGREAIDMIAVIAPDVMTLDVVMPVEDGVTVLERVMRICPLPTLMLSSVTTENAEYTFAALEAGAVDFVTKPSGLTHMNMPRIADELVTKIRTAAQVDVRTLGPGRHEGAHPPVAPVSDVEPESGASGPEIDAFVVGCSTGGPAAIKVLLNALPANLDKPVLIVQHMPLGFTTALATRLDALSKVSVREVNDGDLFEGGRVFIARSGQQVHIERVRDRIVLRLDKDPADTPHIPSIDVAMTSAARTLGSSAMGALLTGMGTDGARGLLAMRHAGAFTVAESESTAVVWGMPRVAAEMGAAVEIATLPDIADMIVRRLGRAHVTGTR